VRLKLLKLPCKGTNKDFTTTTTKLKFTGINSVMQMGAYDWLDRWRDLQDSVQ